jgi:DNA-binding transcriptional LysR family regulator
VDRPRGRGGKNRLSCNTVVGLAAAARVGLGVAPLPCFLADLDPWLRSVGVSVDDMASANWLLTHPDLRRVARIKAVVDFAAVWLGSRRGLIAGEGPPPSRARAGDPSA